MKQGALQLERMLREGREALSTVEVAVTGMTNTNRKKVDEITSNVLAKLRKLPSTHYRSIPQLKLTLFLLTGLVCRLDVSGAWKREQLDILKKVVL